MKMSKEGITELVRSEGSRAQVYDDRNGQTISSYSQAQGFPTIGVGHLITPSQYARFEKYLGGRSAMTQSQIEDLLKEDLPKYEVPVKNAINEVITQEMFDALVSLAFNAGPNSYAVKNAIKAINVRDWNGAAQAIADGPKTSKGILVQGLVRRRANEAQWFLSGGVPSWTSGIRIFGSQIKPIPLAISSSLLLFGIGFYLYRKK